MLSVSWGWGGGRIAVSHTLACMTTLFCVILHKCSNKNYAEQLSPAAVHTARSRDKRYVHDLSAPPYLSEKAFVKLQLSEVTHTTKWSNVHYEVKGDVCMVAVYVFRLIKVLFFAS